MRCTGSDGSAWDFGPPAPGAALEHQGQAAHRRHLARTGLVTMMGTAHVTPTGRYAVELAAGGEFRVTDTRTGHYGRTRDLGVAIAVADLLDLYRLPAHRWAYLTTGGTACTWAN